LSLRALIYQGVVISVFSVIPMKMGIYLSLSLQACPWQAQQSPSKNEKLVLLLQPAPIRSALYASMHFAPPILKFFPLHISEDLVL